METEGSELKEPAVWLHECLSVGRARSLLPSPSFTSLHFLILTDLVPVCPDLTDRIRSLVPPRCGDLETVDMETVDGTV